jgi:uncharacterized protein YndB with AHSA1/START domain
MAETDLVIERVLEAPRALVWEAYTQAEHVKRWWCPRPWQTPECEIDLRPGGKFYTKMAGPNGEEFSGTGCFLEIVERERLVWTSALGEDWRPNAMGPEAFVFTAVVTLADAGESRTHYRVVAKHADAEAAGRHAAMGFQDGWSAVAAQLEEVAGSLAV